ncbi:hypothetical protein N568_0109875 [Lactococcus garvieae TRF1]|uniref:Uncharacterized protein n=1 Tax=Lactococcus garvieae TRF1 TaxID=1380772 RepID=V8AMP8_9LACT|nr:hypothetical protein N568_0109875 [Lactococcus garvieae TRF1]
MPEVIWYFFYKKKCKILQKVGFCEKIFSKSLFLCYSRYLLNLGRILFNE